MNKFKQYLILGLIIGIVVICALYIANIRTKNSNNTQSPISSYKECIEAGYASLESYPAQCKTPDGQSFTEDIGNENELNNEIRSQSPRPNQTISSPLQIEGMAVGNWFFEASFPAHLVDANGKELVVIPVTAQDEWMTTNFVPYLGTMDFPTPETPTGTLILKKANASGLPENDRELRIPVNFSEYNQTGTQKTSVKVFFSNSSLNAECENTIAITREVTPTPAIARATLEELLKGVSQSEKTKGYTSLINPDVKINALTIKDGVATVDFSSELENGGGGSCRALAIRSQITQTLKQFPTVTSVIISVDGKTEVLQP